MSPRPTLARSAVALGLALGSAGCKDMSLNDDKNAMAAAAEAVLRARGHCPPLPRGCAGHNLFATADGGTVVYVDLYAVPDPAAVAEVVDSCAALSLRSPRRPAVELSVYRIPHMPDPDRGGAATPQSRVYSVRMRHE